MKEFKKIKSTLSILAFGSATIKHLLRLPPTFQDEDVSVDVLHTDPAGQRQRSVRPNPVHHGTQFCQERHQTETENNRAV